MKDMQPTYQELLTRTEWKEKRGIIVKRDFHKCQVCKQEETINEFNQEANCWVYYRIEFGEVTYDSKLGVVQYDEYGKPYWEPFEYVPEIQVFSAQPIQLHVHHKYYVQNKNPWEYPDEALVTLCASCHFELHKVERIPVYENINKVRGQYLTPCTRCNGAGVLPEFSYYQSGICFECNGNMYYELMN
jgi:hypothetical protein